jgi:Holliday junction DNA helicase RuvA
MIGRLVGEVIERELQQILLDVSGVSYEVEIPLSTYYQIVELTGPVTMFTHLVVRDDAHLLFGFATKEERSLFRALIKVNGVGPRLALGILSGLDAESFARCVRDNDLKTLVAIPGIGKKTAERLIIELRDKLAGFDVSAVAVTMPRDVAGDAESALIGLGYKPQEAARAINRVDAPADDVETLIRLALKQLITPNRE